jgi:hypothetical protein
LIALGSSHAFLHGHVLAEQFLGDHYQIVKEHLPSKPLVLQLVVGWDHAFYRHARGCQAWSNPLSAKLFCRCSAARNDGWLRRKSPFRTAHGQVSEAAS